jgi:hypothetical protein
VRVRVVVDAVRHGVAAHAVALEEHHVAGVVEHDRPAGDRDASRACGEP